MALLIAEGFDWLATGTGDISKISRGGQWINVNSTGTSIDTTLNGKTLKSGSTAILTTKLLADVQTLVIGFRYRVEAVASNNLIYFNQVGVASHITLALTSGGALEFFRGATSLGTTATVIYPNTSYYIEVKVKVSNTVGEITCKVDGATVFTFSGDTNNGASDILNGVNFWLEDNGAGYCYVDDIYVLDTTGTVNNDFLGPVIISTLTPSADNSTQLSRSTGSTNYSLVDEVGPNDDTDYVYSATTGQIDLYDFSDLGAGVNTVHGVLVSLCARAENAGVRSIKAKAKSGATTQTSSDMYLSITYKNQTAIFETKNGTDAWTATDVNNAQFGVEIG